MNLNDFDSLIAKQGSEIIIKSSIRSAFNTVKEEREGIIFYNEVTEEEAKKELIEYLSPLFPICPDIEHLEGWKPE
ncbi:hypothetical protein RE474_03290 [Methanolobus sediminis]|uniref:Uncharacterized protein n=1 Tax=Methanolobus sediminis TaxID=3072978 RepID=A0AA51UM29_9EURY|nr:hypothetical protein [Methanolobus sediminis]WMW25757.1 hypothetical protein RE474_03290 [Methanolobus sediminis]